MLGDFNMPNIVWFNDDRTPLPLPSEIGCTTYERAFIKLVHKYSFTQLNHIPNSNGVILDLVLLTSSTAFTVKASPIEEAWDKVSISHIPLAITYSERTAPENERNEIHSDHSRYTEKMHNNQKGKGNIRKVASVGAR